MRNASIGWILLLAVMASALLAQQLSFAQGAPPAVAAGPHSVYLPMIRQPRSTRPAPQPQPQPQPGGGFFVDTDYLTYNAATAVDARGVVHMAFYASDEGHQDAPLGQPAFYTTCSAGVAACADSSKWGALVQMDSSVNEVQVVVTGDGRPRLLVRRNGQVGYDYNYWACEQQCADGASWSGLNVTQANGVEQHSADMPQRSFALDGQGRPRFIWSHSFGNGRPNGIYYAFCDEADCTEPGSWQHTRVAGLDDKSVTADYATLRFAGDSPHFLTRVNHSGLPVFVAYFACSQACDRPEAWESTTLNPPADKQWASWDLELDAQGRPRIALYEPASADIFVGGRLFYGGCDISCDGPDAPFSIVPVASGEGQSVDLAIDPQGRTHMVYDAGQRGALGELWCDTGCAGAAAWKRRILETSEGLMRQLAPASPLTCGQQERIWFDAIPQVSFDAQGRMAVAYDITNYARCYTIDPADPTHRIYSQVRRIWWAVRWAQFPRG
jgi:hypothetical protein